MGILNCAVTRLLCSSTVDCWKGFPTQAFALACSYQGAQCHQHDDNCGSCPRQHQLLMHESHVLSFFTFIRQPNHQLWPKNETAHVTSSSHNIVATHTTAHIQCPHPHFVIPVTVTHMVSLSVIGTFCLQHERCWHWWFMSTWPWLSHALVSIIKRQALSVGWHWVPCCPHCRWVSSSFLPVLITFSCQDRCIVCTIHILAVQTISFPQPFFPSCALNT